MLHVIWTIIKIILLILAVLLGIAAILLLAVLFIPVRYQARGKKGETAAELQAKLSWMGSLINIPVSYQDGVLSAKLRVFGFSVRNLLEEEEPFAEFEKEFFTEAEKETEKIEEETFAESEEETREREPSQSREFSEGQAPPVKQGKLKCTFKRFCFSYPAAQKGERLDSLRDRRSGSDRGDSWSGQYILSGFYGYC